MNHVFGNGEASPISGYDFGNMDCSVKNEFKGTAYIKCKHVINSATLHTLPACHRYVILFINSSTDVINKTMIRRLFIQKQLELYTFISQTKTK